MRRFNPEKELRKIRYGKRNKVIFSIVALLFIIAIGSSYALYQVRYSKRIIYTKVAQFSNKDLNLAVYVDGVQQKEFPEKNNNITFIDLVCDNGTAISSWDNDAWGLRILTPIILPNKCNAYFTTEENVIKEFSYSGHEEEYEIPKDGLYKIELWGASGGNEALWSSLPGYGGYTSGVITLKQNEKLYFYLGEKGAKGVVGRGLKTKSSFNGGGSGIGDSGDVNDAGGAGGGATDVRLEKGTTWDDFNSLKSRIMVAAGGGGAAAVSGTFYSHSAGFGGGLTGVGDSQSVGGNYGTIFNATQTTGYKFGIGQDGFANTSGGGGGGGGYYGGLATNTGSYYGGGGGGSSFISGHPGCNAINASSTDFDNIQPTGNPNHYSNKIFTSTIMIDGEGYYWTDTRQTYIGMPTFDGTGTMEGNNDNGYARITYIGPKS